MKSGLKKLRPDHRDFDFHRTFGATMPLTGIPDFNVDAGLWAPNQNVPESWPPLSTPALPYGCTDFIQTDLCIDEDGILHDPMLMENVTHANANGGCDLRTALSAAKRVFNRPAYFAIRPNKPLDWFDAIRLSLYSTKDQKRSASIGSKWFYDFQYLLPNNVVPMPMNLAAYTYHNWKVSGQKTINGIPHLIAKPLEGRLFGDNGFCYIPREVMNFVMSEGGAGAFTLGNPDGNDIQKVDLSIIGVIVSYMLRLLHL